MKILKCKILKLYKMIPVVIRTLRQIFKYGGYKTINIASVNYGEILKGKKVLITGGGSGIGLSIAKKCLSEGAIVVITGRNISKLKKITEEINNPSLKYLCWDISEISKIDENIAKTVELLGSNCDILVNNAGIVFGEQFPYIKEENFDKIYATNSKGLFFLTQSLCAQWMKKETNNYKKIINISSQGGFVGATYPYRMTKWDIVGLTQGLGIKLAPYGILVNGIAPGIVQTDAMPYLQERKENIYASLDANPLERFALPVEIAELACFLMSDASNFIVGQTIVCDGGFSIK